MTAILNTLSTPFGLLLKFFYSLTGNYIISVILLALASQIVLDPFSLLQRKSKAKLAILSPQINILKAKYSDPGDKNKLNDELVKLYAENKYRPFSSCIAPILQVFVIICIYQAIISPLRYITGLSQSSIIALKDAIVNTGAEVPSRYSQFGMIDYLRSNGVDYFISIVPELKNAVLPSFIVGPFNLSCIPSLSPVNNLAFVPIIAGMVMALGTFFMNKRANKMQNLPKELRHGSAAVISMLVPTLVTAILTIYILFKMPAIVSIYWLSRNVFDSISKLLLKKLCRKQQLSH